MRTKIARIIRVISIPPIMAALMLTILYQSGAGVFTRNADYGIALLCLCGLPSLAYPLQKLIPKARDGGRRAQRKLAFIFSVVSYVLLLVYALVAKCTRSYRCIALYYTFSVVILSIVNKATPYHASGHACSFAAVPICLVRFVSWLWIVPGALLGSAMIWSSLELKRHTATELILGFVVSIIAFLLSIFALGI